MSILLQLVYNANTDASTCLQLFTVYVYSRCGRISTSLCLWLKDKLRRLRRWHCQWSQGSSSSPKYRPSSVVHLTKTYKNSILCSTARLIRHFTWLVILPILQTFANELAWKQSCWQDEHVCHGVLEANGDEHRNGEPNSHHFAREILKHRHRMTQRHVMCTLCTLQILMMSSPETGENLHEKISDCDRYFRKPVKPQDI